MKRSAGWRGGRVGGNPEGDLLVAGLDCTGEGFSAAVVRGEICLAEVSGSRPRSQLRLLYPSLMRALEMAGVGVGDLEAVAVTTGPGSFTGVRLGVMTARTLAQVVGCPVVGVDTCQALALNCPDAECAVAALDARRGEIAAAPFRVRSGRAQPLAEARLFAPRELAGWLAARGGAVVLGSAVERYRQILAAVPGVNLLPPGYAAVRGSAVGRLGVEALAEGRAVPPLQLMPRYFRPPEVQVHRGH